MGAIEDSISLCTFLQMTYTAENPHADGRASPGARPLFQQTCCSDPHATSPAPTTTGCLEDRCPVVSKQLLHSRAAANMSPHIRISQEPVLTDHAWGALVAEFAVVVSTAAPELKGRSKSLISSANLHPHVLAYQRVDFPMEVIHHKMEPQFG
jgi:hypothetical protein